MSSRLLLKGGRIVSPGSMCGQVVDVAVADGKVLSIGSVPAGFTPDTEIDAAGHWISAGFIDLSHTLRQPGLEHKATISSEVLAAARGGFTTLCTPPSTSPVNDSAAVTNLIYDQALEAAQVKVLPIGAMTKGLQGEQLSEMFALRQAGCIAVTNMRRPFRNNQVLKRCLEYACSQDIRAFVCPQDAALAKEGCAHDGAMASKLGLVGIPAIAEVLSVAQWLILAEETEAQVHFSQISCARSVSMISEAKSRGLKVTADVAIANLMHTDAVIAGYNPMYHVEPPLRSEADRKALLEGVNEGVIDAICSNHEPHESAAKQAPFAETAAGMSQAELLWSQMVGLIQTGQLRQDAAIRALTVGPAAVLNIESGSLESGAVADLVVLDPDTRWTVSEDSLLSRGKNTPWIGKSVQGRALYTILDGTIVYSAEGSF
ncbi:dihydroorotase [Hahella sp. CCB-MM4]|uniref:dihydroorotase n=1 Tax=Hahella sp. (strain CCB-MM4) TaxID=1926491 RepID=UPI000B9B868B|nr:dihydroorotase [Hahella sp. CCB-MM4]OZG75142.1 dihydroorotase [Hahella sp. CCB-MM4]